MMYLKNPLAKIRLTIQHFLLVTVYGMWGDLVLSALLEYQSHRFAFDITLFSFAVSSILISIMLVMLYSHVRLIQKYQVLKVKNPDALEAFEKDNEGVEPLYSDFVDESASKQGFLILLTFRELFFSIIITTLYNFPRIQVSIFSANSILFMIYLIAQRPFKRKFDLFQQIFFELLGLMVNISVLFNGLTPLLYPVKPNAPPRRIPSMSLYLCFPHGTYPFS